MTSRRPLLASKRLPQLLTIGRFRNKAGSDIVAGDRIGGLAVSQDGVATRDRLVIRALAERGIPTVVVTSGGYTETSHRLVAQLAVEIADMLAAG